MALSSPIRAAAPALVLVLVTLGAGCGHSSRHASSQPALTQAGTPPSARGKTTPRPPAERGGVLGGARRQRALHGPRAGVLRGGAARQAGDACRAAPGAHVPGDLPRDARPLARGARSRGGAGSVTTRRREALCSR